MTATMIERVARALASESGFDPDLAVTRMTPLAGRVTGWWVADRPMLMPSWRWFEPLARAAIAAMREPTEAMARAGVDFLRGEDYPVYCADGSYRAMIDAALAKAGKPDAPA